MKRQIDNKRILDLMAQIENTTGKMFHELDKELEERCIEALDGKVPASYVINTLAKKLDEAQS